MVERSPLFSSLTACVRTSLDGLQPGRTGQRGQTEVLQLHRWEALVTLESIEMAV